MKSLFLFIKQKRLLFLTGILFIIVGVFLVKAWVPSVWGPVRLFLLGLPSTEEVVERIRPQVMGKLKKFCSDQDITYPPDRLTLIGLKGENVLEVWGKASDKKWRKLKSYPIIAVSGSRGPKLKEGDRQVPEGIYKVVSLNPNSKFHLSIKINYPNEFDRKMARRTSRQDLGGNIFIHGSNVSIGCLAMGNSAIEELFLLVHDTGASDTKVIIAPYDFRESSNIKTPEDSPEWTGKLYKKIRTELQRY